MDRIKRFDRSGLELRPLAEREHDLDLSCMMPLNPVPRVDQVFIHAARAILEANRRGSAVVMMMGAHVLRSGVQAYLIDLVERGVIGCLAMNGAGVIHDFELALIGATTESVARYIADGSFGLWRETGGINDIVSQAAEEDVGIGQAIGRYIEEERLPHRGHSLLAAAYRCGCPVTVHVGIGYDIVHEHPNCDGAAWGKTSYNDFLRYVEVLRSLEGGVVMNFGSAVMGPEVFLKALAMARNRGRREGGGPRRFTTLVCDLHRLPDDYRHEAPKSQAAYYFRPWKTMLARTVAQGGHSLYYQGGHAQTVPQLWTALGQQAQGASGEQPVPHGSEQ